MNCEHKRQDLLDLAYGELSQQHTEQVADTVHECAACRSELERIENLRSAFRDAMPLEEVPHLVSANILREARLKAYTEPPSVFERLQKLLFHPGFAAAAAVALVLVISGLLFQPGVLQSPADHAEMAAAPAASEESFAEKATPSGATAPGEAQPIPAAAPVVAEPTPALAPRAEVARLDAPSDEAEPLNDKLGEVALRDEPKKEADKGAGADAENVWKLDGKPVARLDRKAKSPTTLDELLGASRGARPGGSTPKTPVQDPPAKTVNDKDQAFGGDKVVAEKKREQRAPEPLQAQAVVPADLDNLNADNDAPEAVADAEEAKDANEQTVKQAEWNPGYRPGNPANRAKAGSNSAVGFGSKSSGGLAGLDDGRANAKGGGSSSLGNVYGGAPGSGDQAAEGAPATDENATRKRYERGLSRYQRGDYGNAVRDFDAFMNDAPRSSNYYALAMYYKGRSLLNRGNGAGAVAAFRSVIGEYPQSEKRDDARYWLAKSLLRSDPQNAEAQQILSQLMSGKSAVAGNARDTYDRSFGKSTGKDAPRPTVGKKALKRSAPARKKNKSKMDYYDDSPAEKQMEAVE